jgi:hypothetical protein
MVVNFLLRVLRAKQHPGWDGIISTSDILGHKKRVVFRHTLIYPTNPL